jgi:uncharacterized membrane protein YoaK (UPF0700 family)
MGAGAAVAPMWPDPATRTRDLLLIGLTVASGVVDAVSYLGLGRIFTANMTGNIVFLALAVGDRSLVTALYSVGALLGFAVGAMFAGQVLGRTRPPGPWPRRVTWLLGGELVCVVAFAAGWAVVGGRPTGLVPYALIGLSSFGMGIQNAAARHLAVPGLTTTVVTTALTGFMVDLPALGMSGPTQGRAAIAVVVLFSGAAIGAAVLDAARSVPPFLTVAIVLVVLVVAQTRLGGRAASPA